MTATSMRKALGDPFYVGRAPYKGQMRRWKHLSLTDEETFARCQVVLAEHNRYADRMRKHEFLLSGLARCGICGAPYTASVNAGKGKAYYHCPPEPGAALKRRPERGRFRAGRRCGGASAARQLQPGIGGAGHRAGAVAGGGDARGRGRAASGASGAAGPSLRTVATRWR